MRKFAVAVLLLCGGCPEKKAAPKPQPATEPTAGEGGGSTAPVLQPVERKLDEAMKKNDDRAAPEAE